MGKDAHLVINKETKKEKPTKLGPTFNPGRYETTELKRHNNLNRNHSRHLNKSNSRWNKITELKTVSTTEKETKRKLFLLAGDIEQNSGPDPCSMLTVISWNCRSIGNKGSYIQRILSAFAPDVLCLQETWAKGVITHPGYYTHRLDRESHGGGVITIVKKCLTQTRVAVQIQSNKDNAEVIGVKIGSSIDIINVYIPPNAMVLSGMKFKSKTVVVGDFNAHYQTWPSKTTKAGVKLLALADHKDLLITNRPGSITRPTPEGGTVIFFGTQWYSSRLMKTRNIRLTIDPYLQLSTRWVECPTLQQKLTKYWCGISNQPSGMPSESNSIEDLQRPTLQKMLTDNHVMEQHTARSSGEPHTQAGPY